MTTHYDAIVVGGGVNGVAITYNLVKRGMKVLLLEKGKLASKSSRAAAGMLGAQAELDDVSPLFMLAKQSREMFPRLQDELYELSKIDIELINKGMYKIALNEEQEAEFKRIIEIHRQAGEIAEWLDGDEVRGNEPVLSNDVRGAMYIPKDGHVEPYKLSQAFALSAAILGAKIKEFTEVYSIINEDNKVKGVVTNEGTFYSEHVIVAGGAWSGHILQQAGVELDVYPVKGECLSVKTSQPIVEKTIFSHGCYFVPKVGGRTIIGATMKANTFNEDVSIEGIYNLLDRAKKIIPSIVDSRWEKTWAGIRPQTGDGLPYLGEHPEIKGLFIATGHFRNGILLSPITGVLIADLVQGRYVSELETFNLKRIFKKMKV